MSKNKSSKKTMPVYRAEVLEYVGSSDDLTWNLMGVFNVEKQALDLLKTSNFVRVFRCYNGERKIVASNFNTDDFAGEAL